MNAPLPTDTEALIRSTARSDARYRRKAWLALTALLVFLVLYLSLTVGFFAVAVLVARSIPGNPEPVAEAIIAICCAFLGAFMLKALFFVRRGNQSNELEIQRAEQPELFAFLDELAAQVGTTRPHRVFVSNAVNACVFYDLSILNLLIPARKNLEIGLPLVNGLTVSEFKAVLAHEFGHFSQKSMAVGRWVYTAQQIAGHIVSQRGAFDQFVNRLSRFDLRVAWIGWILSAVMWLIRHVVDLCFRAAWQAQRALSHEMEFHADRVAVRLTGSDALIDALYKLDATDNAWRTTVSFADRQARRDRPIRNLYPVQQYATTLLREIYGIAHFGDIPPPADEDRASQRLFAAGMGRPPQMWSSHPLNCDREAQAKQIYHPAPRDPRPAWTLFCDQEALQTRVTLSGYHQQPETFADATDTLADLRADLLRPAHDPQYRGIYLGRALTRDVATAAELYLKTTSDTAPETLLVPVAQIQAVLDRLETCRNELQQLEGLHRGTLTAPGNIVVHRGTALKIAALPQAIAAVGREVQELRAELRNFDQRNRTGHLLIARALDSDWESYLRGLGAVLHYAEHTHANLRDAQVSLQDVVMVARSRHDFDDSDVRRILHACSVMHMALTRVWEQATDIVLDTMLLERLHTATWSEQLEEFQLPPANSANLQQWLGAIDGWVDSACNAVVRLQQAALDQLLITEGEVQRARADGSALPHAPVASTMPERYTTLVWGDERSLESQVQTPPRWTRWLQRPDGSTSITGWAALAIGVLVLAAIPILYLTTSRIVVYNGLGRPVQVDIGQKRLLLDSASTEEITLWLTPHVSVRTSDRRGKEIEHFEVEPGGFLRTSVYNIAGAGVYSAQTGKSEPVTSGHARWQTLVGEFSADEKSFVTTSKFLLMRSLHPEYLLTLVPAGERPGLIETRARWETENSLYLLEWLRLAQKEGVFDKVVAARLFESPTEMATLYAQQNFAFDNRAEICSRHTELAKAHPVDASLQFLAASCLSDSTQRRAAIMRGHNGATDNGWLAMGAAYLLAQEQDFARAYDLLDRARQKEPVLTPWLALDLTRLKRLRAHRANPDVNWLRDYSPALNSLLALEDPREHITGPAGGYAHLHHGDIAGVQSYVDASDQGARLLRLAAASDGARQGVIDRALGLPANQGIDHDTLWPSIALAVRERSNADALYALAPNDASTQALRQLIRYIRAGQLRAADELLALLPLHTKARGYSIGTILLGEKAPKQWRDGANFLLFSAERPFFRG